MWLLLHRDGDAERTKLVKEQEMADGDGTGEDFGV